jgi:hypothetical protein
MVCPKCGGQMKVVAFITDYAAVDWIIDHPKLTFISRTNIYMLNRPPNKYFLPL